MIVLGDTPEWRIVLTNRDGGPLDLTGHTVTVTFKASVTDPDENAVFQHYIRVSPEGTVAPGDSHGMEIGPDGVEAGVILEYMTAEESAAITVKRCKGDLEVRYDDKIHTAIPEIEEKFKPGYTNAAP